MKVERRTQAGRSAATRDALVAAARPLFTEHGYAGVGTEAIVRAAGVTRGAMYHQFADKTELFAAAVEAAEADLSARLLRSVASLDPADPVVMLQHGTRAWLEACTEPEVQRVVLVDGPAVLGWERWRAICLRHSVGLLRDLLDAAVATGRMVAVPVLPLTHLVVGALDEAALYIARSPDPDATRAEVVPVVERLLAGLAASPPPSPSE